MGVFGSSLNGRALRPELAKALPLGLSQRAVLLPYHHGCTRYQPKQAPCCRRQRSNGHLIAVDGSKVPVSADTLCIHGDKATALPFVRALREALSLARVEVRAH